MPSAPCCAKQAGSHREAHQNVRQVAAGEHQIQLGLGVGAVDDIDLKIDTGFFFHPLGEGVVIEIRHLLAVG